MEPPALIEDIGSRPTERSNPSHHAVELESRQSPSRTRNQRHHEQMNPHDLEAASCAPREHTFPSPDPTFHPATRTSIRPEATSTASGLCATTLSMTLRAMPGFKAQTPPPIVVALAASRIET
jgi:hypothetical protein